MKKELNVFLPAYNNLNGYIKRHFKSLFSFLTPYKIYNIILALFEMQMRKTINISKPFMYRIDPCSLCNLRCVSCSSHKTTTLEKRIMDLDDFKKIVNNIESYALRASLYDMGEPLLNKNIYSMLKYASDKNISTLISTNFNLFKKEHLNVLFKSGLTVLEPCLDGFTQEKYAKYRKRGNVELVKEGIKMVMEQKIFRKAKWPIVDVQIVLFDHIKDEISYIRNFLTKCKVDTITYRQENLGFNSPDTTIANRVEPNRHTCFWLYIGMTIRPDGNVYPCCGRDFDRFPYGNILKEPLSEIWNNKYYQFSRALFQKGSDLNYNEEMQAIPCITCNQFRKQRKISREKGIKVRKVKESDKAKI